MLAKTKDPEEQARLAREAQLFELRDKYNRQRNAYRALSDATYPKLAFRELERMRDRYAELGGKLDDLPRTPPPLPSGRAPIFA